MHMDNKKNTNEKSKTLRNKKILYNICFMLFVIILYTIPTNSVFAATSLKLQYSGKTVTYTSTQAKVTYNNVAVNLNGTPALIFDNTTMVSYQDVYANSVIKATCSYTSSSGVILIKRGTTTIKMTVGSKTAYVNGKKKTLDSAPKKVTFVSAKKTKVLVPARFVTENLGFGYTWNSSTKTSEITGPLFLTYDGMAQTYNGTKGTVTVNGKKIDVSDMPSIIINDTALIRAKKVFTSSSIGAKYTYDSTKKVLVLSKGNVKITLTMGSKIADVNGTKYTMSTAARLVKNNSSGINYVMVPGSFVATKLGLQYAWNTSVKTSVITTSSDNSSNNGNTGSTDGNNGGTAYFTLTVSNALLEEYNHVKNISNSEVIADPSTDIAVIQSITKSKLESNTKEQYVIKASAPLNGVTPSFNSNILTFELGHTSTNNEMYYFDNSLVNTIAASTNSSALSSSIKFTLASSKSYYEYSLSADKHSLTVTIYPNYISSIAAFHNSNADNVVITGLSLPNKTITQDSNNVYVDLPYMINSVGTTSKIVSNGTFLTKVSTSTSSPYHTRITIAKKSGTSYYATNNGNQLIISILSTTKDYDLKIMKPSAVEFSSIKTEDLYLSKKFTITIPGDYVSFYQSNPIVNLSTQITSTKVSLNSDGDTVITLTESSILGFKLTDNGDSILVKVGKPNEIYKKIVVLDPGHGGTYPGANSNGVNEKTLTFKILYTYLNGYLNSSSSDIKVYYTRINDTTFSKDLSTDLDARAAFAKKVGADFFISLHMNSASSTAAYGTEVYYSSSNNSKSSSGLTSEALAKKFVTNITSSIGFYNRGVKSARFVVVHKNTVPAILVELGFISNPSDFNKITDPANQKKIAKCFYDTIVSIFKEYPTGR